MIMERWRYRYDDDTMTSWLLHQQRWRYDEDAMTSWLLHLLRLRWNWKWQHHQMLVGIEDYLMVGRLIVYCEGENACHASSCGVYVWPTWWRSDHTGDTCISPVFSSALPCLRPLSSLLSPWRIELMQQRRRGHQDIVPMVKDNDGACIMMCGVHGHFHSWYVLRLRRDVHRKCWRQIFLGAPPRGNFGKWRHLGEISGSGATSGKWREVTGELDGNKIVWPTLSWENYRCTEEFSTPEKKLRGNREGSNRDHW